MKLRKTETLQTRTFLAYAFLVNGVVLNAASCGDENDPNDDGSAGSPSSGGSSGASAGDTGQPGGAGAGAEGGTGSGKGGSATGGTGKGGSSSGGDSSGAGSGGAEAGGGGAGAGGAGGDSTEGARSCQVGCQSQDDCATETAEIRRCDLSSMRCIECLVHADCVPVASAWSVSCTEDTDCFTDFGEVCVDVGGYGRCASAHDPELGCFFEGEVPLTYPKFGASSPTMVDVCGKESGRCENLRCFTGCTDEPDFCTTGLNQGNGNTCDPQSGRCTCAGDGECTGGPEHCNPTTHRCDECAEPDDCAGAAEGKDACVDGRCGCSDASICPTATFPAGTPVCE